MRPHTAATTAAAAAAALVLACAGGLANEPPYPDPPGLTEPTAAAAEVPVGAAVTAHTQRGTAIYNLLSVQAQPQPAAGGGGGRTWLLAQVTVTAGGRGWHTDPYEFELVTDDGSSYPSTPTTAFPDRAAFAGLAALPGGPVPAGATVSGWVVFDVPAAAAAGGRIRLTDRPTDGIWRL